MIIHQDANLYLATIKDGDRLNYNTESNRSLWIQVATGSLEINGQALKAGDGAAITQESQLAIAATNNDTQILLFDLADLT